MAETHAISALAEMLEHGYIQFYTHHVVFSLNGNLCADADRARSSLDRGIGPAILLLHKRAKKLYD